MAGSEELRDFFALYREKFGPLPPLRLADCLLPYCRAHLAMLPAGEGLAWQASLQELANGDHGASPVELAAALQHSLHWGAYHLPVGQGPLLKLTEGEVASAGQKLPSVADLWKVAADDEQRRFLRAHPAERNLAELAQAYPRQSWLKVLAAWLAGQRAYLGALAAQRHHAADLGAGADETAVESPFGERVLQSMSQLRFQPASSLPDAYPLPGTWKAARYHYREAPLLPLGAGALCPREVVIDASGWRHSPLKPVGLNPERTLPPWVARAFAQLARSAPPVEAGSARALERWRKELAELDSLAWAGQLQKGKELELHWGQITQPAGEAQAIEAKSAEALLAGTSTAAAEFLPWRGGDELPLGSWPPWLAEVWRSWQGGDGERKAACLVELAARGRLLGPDGRTLSQKPKPLELRVRLDEFGTELSLCMGGEPLLASEQAQLTKGALTLWRIVEDELWVCTLTPALAQAVGKRGFPRQLRVAHLPEALPLLEALQWRLPLRWLGDSHTQLPRETDPPWATQVQISGRLGGRVRFQLTPALGTPGSAAPIALAGPSPQLRKSSEGWRLTTIDPSAWRETIPWQEVRQWCSPAHPTKGWIFRDKYEALECLHKLRQAGINHRWQGDAGPSLLTLGEELCLRVLVGAGSSSGFIHLSLELLRADGRRWDLGPLLASVGKPPGAWLLEPNVAALLPSQIRGLLGLLTGLRQAQKAPSSPWQMPRFALLYLHQLRAEGVELEGLDNALSPFRLSELLPTAYGQLKDHQKLGVQWLFRLHQMGLGGLLADDMGVGKTAQALAYLEWVRGEGPSLLVIPAYLRTHWYEQAKRFAPLLEVSEPEGLKGAKAGDLVVVSYAWLAQGGRALAKQKFACAVFDEAQLLSNGRSKRFQGAKQIQAGCRIGLSGTPLQNRWGELWSLFRLLLPGLLGKEPAFRRQFGKRKPPTAEGAERLRQLLTPFVLRRTKEEVLTQLPPLGYKDIWVQASEEEATSYGQLRTSLLQSGANPEDQAGLLAALTRLRQGACDLRLVQPDGARGSKSVALGELLEGALGQGQQVVVFSSFVGFLDLLKADLASLGSCVQQLDGRLSAAQRSSRVAAFQGGENQVLLVSLKAGGLGIDLSRANLVVLMDPWWNHALEQQAMDRAHRPGQRGPVQVVRLLRQASIDEGVVQIQAEKDRMIDQLWQQTSGKDSARLRRILLRVLSAETASDRKEEEPSH